MEIKKVPLALSFRTALAQSFSKMQPGDVFTVLVGSRVIATIRGEVIERTEHKHGILFIVLATVKWWSTLPLRTHVPIYRAVWVSECGQSGLVSLESWKTLVHPTITARLKECEERVEREAQNCMAL